MIKTSYTKIDTYLSCPFKYKMMFLGPPRKIKSNAMAIGEGLHGFLEFYAKNPNASLQECEDMYVKKALAANSLESQSEVGKFIHLVGFYKKSGALLKPLRHNGVLQTEQWAKLKCGDVEVNGKIDIITEKKAVVDYKTSSKRYPVEDMKHLYSGKGLQLSMYAAMFWQRFGEAPYKVGYQVIIKDGSEIQNIGGTRSEQECKDTIDWVRNIAHVMDQEKEFAKKGEGSACWWCDYKEQCDK